MIQLLLLRQHREDDFRQMANEYANLRIQHTTKQHYVIKILKYENRKIATAGNH